MKFENSILGNGSISLKPINQDFSITVPLPQLEGNVIIVADGLGSFYKSEEASRFVCDAVVEIIKNQLNLKNLSISVVFERITQKLKLHAESLSSSFPNGIKNSLGTTLICCIETPEEYIIGYVGNGGIFHIRGDFDSFPERFYLPWNSINLLNPHSVEQEGKNAMYRLISPSSKPNQFTPSVLRLTKDELHHGDIIMICSDGIYSYDEVQMGKDPDGKIWISGEETMELFYKNLSLFFKEEVEWNAKTLNMWIENYLEEIKKVDLLSDDATLAVLVSERTLNSKFSQKEKLNEEESLLENSEVVEKVEPIITSNEIQETQVNDEGMKNTLTNSELETVNGDIDVSKKKVIHGNEESQTGGTEESKENQLPKELENQDSEQNKIVD